MRASQIVRAAVVQAASVAFDRERTLEKAGDLTADAARRGAQLVVFPEAFVSGYPRGSHFGTVVGARTAEGREEFRRYWASAVDVPGPAVDALGEIARENGVYLVMGVIEARGRHALLHGPVLRADRPLPRQAPQADADRRRAARLGLR